MMNSFIKGDKLYKPMQFHISSGYHCIINIKMCLWLYSDVYMDVCAVNVQVKTSR